MYLCVHVCVSMCTDVGNAATGIQDQISSRWACEKCSFLNDCSTSACAVCGAPRYHSSNGMHICMYVCLVCMGFNTYICTYICTHIHVYLSVCMGFIAYICTYICTHMHVCVSVCIGFNTYICIYICTHIHVCACVVCVHVYL